MIADVWAISITMDLFVLEWLLSLCCGLGWLVGRALGTAWHHRALIRRQARAAQRDAAIRALEADLHSAAGTLMPLEDWLAQEAQRRAYRQRYPSMIFTEP